METFTKHPAFKRKYRRMIKVQCPEIQPGENVHEHYCNCCNGKQHIKYADALKYKLRGLLVLTDDGSKDASDCTMHTRIAEYIRYHKSLHNYTGSVSFDALYMHEPIATLNACIDTLKFNNARIS